MPVPMRACRACQQPCAGGRNLGFPVPSVGASAQPGKRTVMHCTDDQWHGRGERTLLPPACPRSAWDRRGEGRQPSRQFVEAASAAHDALPQQPANGPTSTEGAAPLCGAAASHKCAASAPVQCQPPPCTPAAANRCRRRRCRLPPAGLGCLASGAAAEALAFGNKTRAWQAQPAAAWDTVWGSPALLPHPTHRPSTA